MKTNETPIVPLFVQGIPAPIALTVDETPEVPLYPQEIQITRYSEDPYVGPYTVIPKTYEQTFATMHKTMAADLKVLEIPYYETSNPQGGNTVYIGE